MFGIGNGYVESAVSCSEEVPYFLIQEKRTGACVRGVLSVMWERLSDEAARL